MEMIGVKTITNYGNKRSQVLDTWKFILDTANGFNCIKFFDTQNKPIEIFFTGKYVSLVYTTIVNMIIQTSHQRIFSHNNIIKTIVGCPTPDVLLRRIDYDLVRKIIEKLVLRGIFDVNFHAKSSVLKQSAAGKDSVPGFLARTGIVHTAISGKENFILAGIRFVLYFYRYPIHVFTGRNGDSHRSNQGIDRQVPRQSVVCVKRN